MELMIPPGRLDRPVDHETDHVLGLADAEITLVEYGSYACPHCRAANKRIAQALDQTRRPRLLRLPPQAALVQQPFVSGRRAR